MEPATIALIIFGTLFSDLTFMIEIAEETNGLFIFNSTFKKIKNDALLLYEMLSNIQAIEITGEDWTNATSFEVTINGKNLIFVFNKVSRQTTQLFRLIFLLQMI